MTSLRTIQVLLILLFSIFHGSMLQRCEVFPRAPLGMTDRYGGIPDEKITASSYLNSQTHPKYGRLHFSDGHIFFRDRDGAGAWIANDQDTNQWIQVDLGERRVVSGIATQGRKGAREWVQDFYLQYADDDTARNFLYYKDDYGSPFLFIANVDDGNTTEHTFQQPIIARFVRVNPQRWHNLISMRFELYGCRLESYIANFDGKSRMEVYFPYGVQTVNDSIRFRFRTRQSDGLLLYGSSSQNDVFSVELYRSQLRIVVNLGDIVSEGRNEGTNIITAGSLLDDNMWHDVYIVRNERMFNVTVDRMLVWTELKAEFLHLNLDDKFFLGGLDIFTNKLFVKGRTNFTGCIENFWMNGLNIIRDAVTAPNSSNAIQGFQIVGNVGSSCNLQGSVNEEIMTFDADAVINVERDPSSNLQVSLSFRTFQKDTNLLFHSLNPSTTTGTSKYVALDIHEDGTLKFDLNFDDTKAADIRVYYKNRDTANHFADGLWHKLYMHILENEVRMTIDGVEYKTVQKFSVSFRERTNIGWCPQRIEKNLNKKFRSFRGCIKSPSVQGLAVTWENIKSKINGKVVNGSCTMRDHCMPNPCKRNAKCSQDHNEFYCDCPLGYKDSAVCHQSSYFTSCSELQLLYPIVNERNDSIDLDGSQILNPMFVTCNFRDNQVRTIVRHNTPPGTTVDGYEQPGSYKHTLNYNTSVEALTELVRRGVTCRQLIEYRCKNARLLSRPTLGGTTLSNRAYGWWVSRRGQPRFYWGGSAPGHQKCDCGVKGICQRGAVCNCDSFAEGETSGSEHLTDTGYLEYKDDLPVSGVRFGDTGSAADNKEALFTVGPLECDGDTMFDNTVTFRKHDAVLEVDPIYSETEFDIRFLFKTTQEDSVLFQNVDPDNGTFIEVRLKRGRDIQFSFNVGYGVRSLSSIRNEGATGSARTSIIYNDNRWHIVHVERNRKEYTLRVDQESVRRDREPQDQAFRFLRFNTKLFIGATATYNEGYVGCLSNFMVNGVIQNLRKIVEEHTENATLTPMYGLSAGCKPNCEPNPCINRGECVEHYSHFYCECGMTPFRGYICGREVGATFRSTSDQIRVNISEPTGRDSTGLTTIDEYIQIGFKTRSKTGILMQIRDDSVDPPGGPRESLVVRINNGGGITVDISLGFEWHEVTTSRLAIDLANDQHHTVVVYRSKGGKQVNIKIDDYPVQSHDFSSILSDDSDTRLDNPAFIYIGKNQSAMPGFEGCIYRAQFNNIFPLKAAFRDPLVPEQVYKTSGVREDYCGFEEIQPPEIPVERRPYPKLPDDLDFGDRRDLELPISIILLIIFVALVLVVAICVACFFRHYTFERGDYDTNEAKGAELTDDPDLALKFAQGGQPEVRGKEWWL